MRLRLVSAAVVVFAGFVSIASLSAQEVRPRAVFGGHAAVVTSLGVTPDGKMLATAGYAKTVKLWDIASGKEITALAGRGPLAMSPDGATLAFGGDGLAIRLWDIATRRDIGARVRRTPDSQSVISGGGIQFQRGEAKLWDVAAILKDSAK